MTWGYPRIIQGGVSGLKIRSYPVEWVIQVAIKRMSWYLTEVAKYMHGLDFEKLNSIKHLTLGLRVSGDVNEWSELQQQLGYAQF